MGIYTYDWDHRIGGSPKYEREMGFIVNDCLSIYLETVWINEQFSKIDDHDEHIDLMNIDKSKKITS